MLKELRLACKHDEIKLSIFSTEFEEWEITNDKTILQYIQQGRVIVWLSKIMGTKLLDI